MTAEKKRNTTLDLRFISLVGCLAECPDGGYIRSELASHCVRFTPEHLGELHFGKHFSFSSCLTGNEFRVFVSVLKLDDKFFTACGVKYLEQE